MSDTSFASSPWPAAGRLRRCPDLTTVSSSPKRPTDPEPSVLLYNPADRRTERYAIHTRCCTEERWPSLFRRQAGCHYHRRSDECLGLLDLQPASYLRADALYDMRAKCRDAQVLLLRLQTVSIYPRTDISKLASCPDVSSSGLRSPMLLESASVFVCRRKYRDAWA